MSLTAGSGPLGERPSGRFDVAVPERVLFIEGVHARIRGVADGETVVDSPNAQLLHETGRLPVYHFPAEEVRGDLLTASGEREPSARGELAWHDLRVSAREVPRAAWTYPEPSAPWLAGLVAFRWNALDEWFAEAEQLFGHPRDPYSRIDVCRTTRHVRVALDGHVLADSRRARVLYEAGLPPRWYLPPADVRTDLLVPSGHLTRCAYKGAASYWHARVGDRIEEDLVWSYPDPAHDALPVRDMLCFFDERVDLELDGVPQERPATQWSRDEGAGGATALRGLMGRPDA
ncbi:MAG: DUF427 domain-containing protein [Solirubrobacteraceae bacterium]